METDKCILKFQKRRESSLKQLDMYVCEKYCESISDLIPNIIRHIQFDHSKDHDKDESIYKLSVCGEPYDLRQCRLCKKIMFVTKKNTTSIGH